MPGNGVFQGGGLGHIPRSAGGTLFLSRHMVVQSTASVGVGVYVLCHVFSTESAGLQQDSRVCGTGNTHGWWVGGRC